MSKRTGRDYGIGIGKETSRGTPVTATYWVPRRNIDFEDKVSMIVDEQAYGVMEDSINVRVVEKWAEGAIGGIVRDKAIGLMLLNIFGQDSVSTPEASVYNHTFTVLSSHQHASLTLVIDDPDGDKSHALSMINSLEIRAELNEYVLFMMNAIGQAGNTATPTAAYVAENDFVSSDITVQTADTAAELGTPTATTLKVRSAIVMFEKDVERDEILGSKSPNDLNNKAFRINVNIEKTLEDTTFKDLFISGSPRAFRLKMQNTGVTLGTAQRPTLIIDLNKVIITEYTTAKGLDDIVTESMTLKANFKITDSKMAQAVLTNEVESY